MKAETPPEPAELKYFVAYTWAGSSLSGHGRASVTRRKPIATIHDINEVETSIKLQSKTLPPEATVMVSSWQRFEEAVDVPLEF